MTSIILTAPLRGWAVPIDEVPDPVFAERMLGDGVAVDPVGDCLHAPCDAEVISIHASLHAITLRTPEGAEILMHIGIDTVSLGGRGFTTLVTAGQQVQRGDPLIRFDLAILLAEARAVVTPMLITNPDAFSVVARHVDRDVGIGHALLTIAPRAAIDQPCAVVDGDEHRLRVTIPLVHGIHARPAARIADCVRRFEAEASLRKGDRSANARSPVSLLALGVTLDDSVEIVTIGPDAADALAALAALIAGGMGESAPATPITAAPAPPLPPVAAGALRGVMAAPGLAVGPARWLRVADRTVPTDGETPAIERARLDAALALVRDRLAGGDATDASAAIRAAHRALLDDPALQDRAHAEIARGRSADHGWRAAMREQADALRASGNARLAERADDLLDLERQVLAALAGEADAPAVSLPMGCILLADDLLPSQVMGLDPAMLAGFCTVRGGPTSHVAILAASMGLPALVAVGEALGTIADGTQIVLDAAAGTLTPSPSAEALVIAGRTIAAQRTRRAEALARAAAQAHTADGVRIEAFANLGSPADARAAIANGAEGCGLLRTEFLFLDRASAPDEAAQARDYQEIADALDGRPLIVRLLDIGGDKPAPYLPIAAEENPALGLRGIRVGLAHPDLLEAQVRAILRVRPVGQCRIMVPMIASVAELSAVRDVLDRARADLAIVDPVQLGVMIETPAAAVTADIIAQQADFLSIGSNDLTQYALAMDRGNAAVAAGIDGLHPAVLRLIAQTCRGGAVHGRWTGICGGLASDPLAIPILIGLGVTELSATPALVPEIKATIRAVTIDRCRDLADRAQALASAADVRRLAAAFRQEFVG